RTAHGGSAGGRSRIVFTRRRVRVHLRARLLSKNGIYGGGAGRTAVEGLEGLSALSEISALRRDRDGADPSSGALARSSSERPAGEWGWRRAAAGGGRAQIRLDGCLDSPDAVSGYHFHLEAKPWPV